MVSPRDYIYKNQWLFVDLGNNEINKIYNQSSIKQNENHSYLVIYEYENLDPYSLSSTPSPAKTTIINNILYFQAVKDHKADSVMDGKYVLYYADDYIKYIHATPYVENNKTKYSYIKSSEQKSIEYDNSQNSPKLYDATPSDVNLYQNSLTSKSEGYYKIAFFNDGIDWKDSVSQKAGAKLIANFSGPQIKIYAKVGPSYGKIKFRIVSRQESPTDVEEVSVDSTEYDCFSLLDEESVIFAKTNLEYKDYNLEIEVLEDKNPLSNSNKFEISKITFLKNMYITLNEQEISNTLVFVSLGGIK